MRLRINLSVPQSGCDRLIYISLFPLSFKLENVMTACSVFSCFSSFLSVFILFLLVRTVLPHFQSNNSTRQFNRIHLSVTQILISLCHSLPADYFTSHWALFVLNPNLRPCWIFCCLFNAQLGASPVKTQRIYMGSNVVNNSRNTPLGEHTWVHF